MLLPIFPFPSSKAVRAHQVALGLPRVLIRAVPFPTDPILHLLALTVTPGNDCLHGITLLWTLG